MPNSIFARILLAGFIIFASLFACLDYGIKQLHDASTNSSKKSELQLQSLLLLSVASIENDKIWMPEDLSENRFNSYDSGLYGFIIDHQGHVLWISESAESLDIDASTLLITNTSDNNRIFTFSHGYYIYSHTVYWELIDDDPQPLAFIVIEDATPTLTQSELFQDKIRISLLVSTIILSIALLIILRWGTRPLRRLAKAIKRIESGDRDDIGNHYPIELTPLTNNLRDLLTTEHKQRERFRTTLADLAHSLKTPLALIQSDLEHPESDHKIAKEQVWRMNDIVQHQLRRAVLTTPSTLTESHQVSYCLADITEALSKVYFEKNVSISLSVPEGTSFRGDPHDLMEILGNLLDNAWKCCNSSVRATALINHKGLIIEIHDDGPGIPKSQREQVLTRGKRLDTHKPGQGIGLDIVHDIVDSYAGHLDIEDSSLGGALFRITLPV